MTARARQKPSRGAKLASGDIGASRGAELASDIGPWPFWPLPPAVVVLLGVAAAAAVMSVGVANLRSQGREAAVLRSRLLGEALAPRLRTTPLDQRPLLLERAAERTGAELLLVDASGSVLIDASLGPPPAADLGRILSEGRGQLETAGGHLEYHATPLGAPLSHLALVTLVRAPEAPFATGSLVASVTALTLLLVSAAALAAAALSRNVQIGVAHLGRAIARMAAGSALAGRPLPVRSLDHVGELTLAFDVLVERFRAAEQAYRQDLDGAREFDRERSAFLSALSHELRTPLNAILGFTEVLLAEVDGPLSGEARENLEMVQSSGAHLRELIDDILDLSGLDSGELRLTRREVDAFAIADAVVREAEGALGASPVRMVLEGGPAHCHADPRRLRQILSNLVGNALKFTAAGEVRVRVAAEPAEACITVSDTGAGIAAAELAAVFEEFRQSGDPQLRRGGTGLGLAITRRLVAMHGGTVRVESQLGRGSRFEVRLPIASRESVA